MHLGIVAQRLKMPDALHRVFDGFLVKDTLVAEGHVQSEALLHQTAENLLLHPPHHLHVDLSVFPEQTQLGFFFLQLPQLGQRPIQRGLVSPQLEHTYTVFSFGSFIKKAPVTLSWFYYSLL